MEVRGSSFDKGNAMLPPRLSTTTVTGFSMLRSVAAMVKAVLWECKGSLKFFSSLSMTESKTNW